MCGVVGIAGYKPAAPVLYDALTMLQHRGQDAAGIATWDQASQQFFRHKGNGLVRDVFSQVVQLEGNMGVGHVRYPTAGTSSNSEAQPLYVNAPYGIVLGHNGNLTNADKLKTQLFNTNKRHINTQSDSEILLNILADELNQDYDHLHPSCIFDAINRLHSRAQGAYTVIGLIANQGLVAFRDPYGLRPLIMGKQTSSKGDQWMLASESTALDVAGFERVRDIKPGESVFIDLAGNLHTHQGVRHSYSPCLFEYVYFARPDSVIDSISVYQARLLMGRLLAEKIRSKWDSIGIDVVMPVPDTARTAALELAEGLGAPYREGFIKNRYIGRTFIMPGQKERKRSVRHKLNPISSEFKGKNVLLVDDSIVRGTTSRKIIALARSAGAKKVYFASASPPVKYQYVYGIDMPQCSDLIAHNRSINEVATLIGADEVFYQDLQPLLEGMKQLNPELDGFDASCFNGQYTTGTVSAEYLATLSTRAV